MGFFKRSKPALAPTCMLQIRGMEYYTVMIEQIGTPLKGFNMRPEQMAKSPLKDFYQLYFECKQVQLVPDPHNKADKNAIKVIVDGRQVGFVPAESTAIVRQYMAVPHSLSANLYGGYFRTWLPSPGRIVQGHRPYTGELIIKLQ